MADEYNRIEFLKHVEEAAGAIHFGLPLPMIADLQRVESQHALQRPTASLDDASNLSGNYQSASQDDSPRPPLPARYKGKGEPLLSA